MVSFKQEFQYQTYKHPYITKGLCILVSPLACPFICCICYYTLVVVAMSGKCGTGKRMERERKRERMSAIHFEKRGRKLNRRKSLSIGQPTGLLTSLRRRKISDQQMSPLLAKLPVEIRTRIYEFALVDRSSMHVYTYDDLWKFHQLRGRTYCTDEEKRLYNNERGGLGTFASPSKTPLLKTCRLIYTEALPILYSQTQFLFQDSLSFFAFSHVTPRSHFQQIRRLRFEEILELLDERLLWNPNDGPHSKAWKSLIENIRSMDSLQSVEFLFECKPIWLAWKDLILESLDKCQDTVVDATTKTCRTHLLVSIGGDLCFEKTKVGSRDRVK